MKQEEAIEKFRTFVAEEGDTLLRLLLWAEQSVAQTILTRLRGLGYDDVSLSELRLLQQLCVSGIRMTELAEKNKLSKQAISQLIDSLEKKGFVMRSPDPEDRRAKVITYTERGYQLIADIIDTTLVVEREVSELLGSEVYQTLKESLVTVNQELTDSLERMSA